MNAMQKTTQAEACATKADDIHVRDPGHRGGFPEAIRQELLRNEV
jgi:hypothetical protein